MISIVCPMYNEENMLRKAAFNLQRLSRYSELIFVDGGSLDRSVDIACQYGKVLHSRKGRAAQMNYGAGLAKGEILLFLHADNVVFTHALGAIERKITGGGVIGGCLTQRIDNDALIYRVIEAQGNFRSRSRKIFYGDQGIFVRKDVFLDIGGFPEVPIMEDVLFTRKLRTIGETVVLPDKIMASARRWEKKGIIKTMFFYNLIIILFWLNVPLDKIKKFYDDLR